MSWERVGFAIICWIIALALAPATWPGADSFPNLAHEAHTDISTPSIMTRLVDVFFPQISQGIFSPYKLVSDV
jgi:hypothetical protein